MPSHSRLHTARGDRGLDWTTTSSTTPACTVPDADPSNQRASHSPQTTTAQHRERTSLPYPLVRRHLSVPRPLPRSAPVDPGEEDGWAPGGAAWRANERQPSIPASLDRQPGNAAIAHRRCPHLEPPLASRSVAVPGGSLRLCSLGSQPLSRPRSEDGLFPSRLICSSCQSPSTGSSLHWTEEEEE